MLAVNQTLTRLALNDNYIGTDGAKALAAALMGNSSIRELQLRGNELGDAGVQAIAEALMVGHWVRVRHHHCLHVLLFVRLVIRMRLCAWVCVYVTCVYVCVCVFGGACTCECAYRVRAHDTHTRIRGKACFDGEDTLYGLSCPLPSSPGWNSA